jgi:hypothetical protein
VFSIYLMFTPPAPRRSARTGGISTLVFGAGLFGFIAFMIARVKLENFKRRRDERARASSA